MFIFYKSVWLCMIFQKKCFSSYILITNQILLSDPFTSLDIGQCVYSNCFLPGFDVINLKINLIFLIELFFYTTKYLEKEIS